MSSSVLNGSALKNFVARSFSAQAAAATKQQSYSLPHHQAKVSVLPRGDVVASLENNSPVSHVAVFVKSGSRYETNDNSGVSHVLRLCSGLATKNFTAFGLTRKLQQMGGNLTVENGREHISYSMSFLRDNLENGFEMLSDIALRPAFKQWELDSVKIRLLTELEARGPPVHAVDLLHKAAFRDSGLGRSLFVPDHRIGNITPEQLHEFVLSTHSSSNLAFVGLGVDHTTLFQFARTMARPQQEGAGTTAPKVVYGGGEIRHENGSPLAYVAVGGPGAKIGSNEAAALAVAQYILGVTPGTKYGVCSYGKLTSFVSQAGGSGVASAINANYTDAGIFGFFLIEEANKAGEVLKAITKGIRSLKVTERDVEAAKKRVKSAILMNSESNEHQLHEMGLGALFSGSYVPSLDAAAAVDKVTASAVQSALSSATKGKASMAAIGGLSTVPYLDQL